MLRQSFQHLPGIRHRTERNLWNCGFRDWGALANYHPTRVTKVQFDAAVDASERAFESRDIVYFGRTMPPREAWRVYREYYEFAGFVDIETTGASRGADSITCIALATRRGVRTFVKNRNLEEFADALRDIPLIVTFNGASFDLPFLASAFGGELITNRAHFDICPALRRAGHGGGLKKIEKSLGVPRDEGLDGLTGAAAVWLWSLYQMGDPRALPTLERYCSEDVLGLPALAAMACNELIKETPFVNDLEPLPVPRRIESYLPFSRDLVAEIVASAAREEESRRQLQLRREFEC